MVQVKNTDAIDQLMAGNCTLLSIHYLQQQASSKMSPNAVTTWYKPTYCKLWTRLVVNTLFQRHISVNYTPVM